MASFPQQYDSNGVWMNVFQLSPPREHAQPSSFGSDTSRARRPSMVSPNSRQSRSSTSSIGECAEPLTPRKYVVGSDPNIAGVGRIPVTPTSIKLDSALQVPFIQSDIGRDFANDPNATTAQWHTFNHLINGFAECVQNEECTSTYPRSSFLPQTSSLPSPTSIRGCFDEQIQGSCPNMSVLPNSDYHLDFTQQAPIPLTSSFDSMIWDTNLSQQDFNSTVNPCDTVTWVPGTYPPYHHQSPQPTFQNFESTAAGASSYSVTNDLEGICTDEGKSLETFDEQNQSGTRLMTPKKANQGLHRGRASTRHKTSLANPSRAGRNCVTKAKIQCQSEQYFPTEPRAKYPCDWEGCNYKSKRSEHLHRHKKMHLGLREFICALAEKGGCEWHKPQKKGESKNWSRADNQRDHYKTHLKGGGRNKCVDKLFLYWCICKYEPEDRSEYVVRKIEESISKSGLVVGEPEHELQEVHPDWPSFIAWRDAGGTLDSLLKTTRDRNESLEVSE